MGYEELRKKVDAEFESKRVTQVFTRYCTKPDKEGVRKILMDNKNICVIKMSQIPFCNGCHETFYSLENKELAKEAREVLEKEWNLTTLSKGEKNENRRIF